MEGLKWWNPTHWSIRLALWRGKRTRRRVMSDNDLRETIEMCTRVAGEHIAWSRAAGHIEGFYTVWTLNYDEFRGQAQELGKLPATHFADLLVDGLKKHFGEGANET